MKIPITLAISLLLSSCGYYQKPYDPTTKTTIYCEAVEIDIPPARCKSKTTAIDPVNGESIEAYHVVSAIKFIQEHGYVFLHGSKNQTVEHGDQWVMTVAKPK